MILLSIVWFADWYVAEFWNLCNVKLAGNGSMVLKHFTIFRKTLRVLQKTNKSLKWSKDMLLQYSSKRKGTQLIKKAIRVNYLFRQKQTVFNLLSSLTFSVQHLQTKSFIKREYNLKKCCRITKPSLFGRYHRSLLLVVVFVGSVTLIFSGNYECMVNWR